MTRLEHLPGNPRYMTSVQFQRLTNNIRADGILTSMPLVYDLTGNDSGPLVILSGNQRVEAAVAAGLRDIDVIEIITRISDERRKAIALSHNAITGQDDPNKLREFYDTLSLSLKQYSGLTDDSFAAAKIDIATLSMKQPTFEQLVIQFLPEAKEVFVGAIERLGKKHPPVALVGRFEDFGTFFDAMQQVKKRANVYNAATALRLMAEYAVAHLERIDGETETIGSGEEERPAPELHH